MRKGTWRNEPRNFSKTEGVGPRKMPLLGAMMAAVILAGLHERLRAAGAWSIATY
jgi:hypothetical protein